MSGPGLIDDYLAGLSAQLPGRIVEELADGLDETYHRYLGQGLDTDAAARTARRLLAAGPAVGLCWAIVLITARARTWPIPVAAYVLFGVALITVIGLVAAAAFGRQYRLVCRAAVAACAGTVLLDSTMAYIVLVITPALGWPVVVAVVLSTARSGFALQNLRHALAG